MMKNILLLFTALFLLSCGKEWLDKKPDNSLVVPISIKDAQALLDDNSRLNIISATGELGVDDYSLSPSAFQNLTTPLTRNAYLWNADIYEGSEQIDWNNAYRRISIANVALETLEEVTVVSANLNAFNTAKGGALFIRGEATLDMVGLYAKPYDRSTANVDPGVPVRLTANVNERSTRGTIQQTYDQILNDLKSAAHLSPVTPLHRTRGSKPAAYALLARAYQNMEDYANAALYADSCLLYFNALIDYNTISTTAANPFVRDNAETIYFTGSSNHANLRPANLIVENSLYQSYQNDDLRKSIYFTTSAGNITRKGSYTGDVGFFNGIASDEIYLIRAEAKARLNNTDGAMNDLNALLVKRYRAGTFTPLTATNAEEALVKVLVERRKELIYRGLRWGDLRRLNKDPRFAKTLTRIVNGVTYSLPPNDNRYTFALPQIEIEKYGLQQNPR